MKSYFCFLISFMLYICNAYADLSSYSRHIYKITDSFNAEMNQSKCLKCNGGGGSFTTDIRSLTLHYSIQAVLDVPAARIMFITAVEDLTRRINTDPKVRPYLHTYPFSPENVRILIGYKDKNYQCVGNGKVALVNQAHGIVYYDRYNTDKKSYESLHEEPYEEALRIVRLQQLCPQLGSNDTHAAAR